MGDSFYLSQICFSISLYFLGKLPITVDLGPYFKGIVVFAWIAYLPHGASPHPPFPGHLNHLQITVDASFRGFRNI